MALKRLRSCLTLSIVVSFLVGCEGVPQLPLPENLAPPEDGLVQSQGRGGYDWNLSSGNFDVAVQSDLAVFEGLDHEKIRQNIPPLTYTEPSSPHRPEGMEDKTYHYYSRYVEPYFDTNPFLTIPFKASKKAMFSIRPTGDQLALISDQLEVWDLDQSKIVNKYSLPTTTPSSLIWSHDQEHVIVMDQNSLTSISVATGKQVQRWEAPDSDSPVHFVHAGKTPYYAVLTKNGGLFALDEQLKTYRSYTGRPLKDSMISIHPEGNSIDAINGRDIIRWNLTNAARAQIETLGTLDPNEEVTGLISGSSFCYLLEPFDFYAITPGEKPQINQFRLNRATHAICMGTVDYSEDFLTCCQSRLNSQGNHEYFVQDYFLGDGSTSFEFPLGTEPVLEMATSRSTDLFAIRDKESLKVFRRQRWKITDGGWTARDVLRLVLDEKFEQAELLTREIGKMPRTRAMTGYIFSSLVPETIGIRWANIETTQNNPGSQLSPEEKSEQNRQLRILKGWRDSGSELAVLASAYRHYTIALRARGNQYASAVSPDNWNQFEKRLDLAQKELAGLLTGPKPECCAIQLAIQTGLSQGNQPDELKAYIKQLLEHYLFDTSTHVAICIHLLPRWGGSAGEAGAYLASVADLVPQPHSDILYTKVALRFYRSYQMAVFNPTEGGLSISRTMRGIDPMIQQKALWMHEAETLLTIATQNQPVELRRKIATFCLENFSISPKFTGDLELTAERNKLLELYRQK